jgi:predicted dehydrogenase
MSQTPHSGPLASDVTRRDFLKGGLVAGAVAGGSLGAFYFGYGAAIASPLRVGVIGTGDQGCVLLGAMNPRFIEVRAIADARPFNQWRAFHGDWASDAALEVRPGLMSVYGWKTEDEARKHVTVYQHWQELIRNARKDGIEGVVIALPLHLHAKAAIAAMQAGLHVLTEKLMAHSVSECKEMALAAEETRKHLATGHQRHYNILYAEAQDKIRRGTLGDLHYIRAQWHRGNLPGNDSWQMPMPEEVKPDDPQAEQLQRTLRSWRGRLAAARGREIDLWRKRVEQIEMQIADKVLAEKITEGPDKGKTRAEAFGYVPGEVRNAAGEVVYRYPEGEEMLRWRLWERTGGGLMAELGSHQLDAATIFIAAAHGGEKKYPLSVGAASAQPLFPPDRDAESHVFCLFEFPAPGYDPKDPEAAQNKIGVQYASINGNGFGGYGEIVFGTKGTLILEREKEITVYSDEAESTVSVAAGAMLDTQASGPEQAAMAAAAREVSRGYTEELEHWAWCVRRNPRARDDGPRPRCHPKIALGDAVIALTTNMAARLGMRIEFNEDWFDPAKDATPERDVLGQSVKPDVARYKPV